MSTALSNRIVITGPESTGKSTLSRRLAAHFGAGLVPEYARGYLESLERPYREADILHIGREQWRRQQTVARRSAGWCVCDTGFLVLKVWSEFIFGRCDPWIQRMLENHPPALYVLCDIDLPWQPDPLREHPDRRTELRDIYLAELEVLGHRWTRIQGVREGERLQQAIRAIEQLPTG